VEDFAETTACVVNIDEYTTKRGKNIHTTHHKYKFVPSKKGKTWSEEILLHDESVDNLWDYALSSDSLKSAEHLGSVFLGKELDRKLIGGTSLKRLIKVTKYLLFAMGIQDVTDDDIYIIMQAHSDKIDVVAAEKTVSILTRTQLAKLEGAYSFLKEHIFGLFVGYLDEVRDFLFQGEYNLPRLGGRLCGNDCLCG
jgi:hypothetical protein